MSRGVGLLVVVGLMIVGLVGTTVATEIDTTATRSPQPPKKSTLARVLAAPRFVLSIPIYFTEQIAKSAVLITFESGWIESITANLLSRDRFIFPIVSYGSRSGIEGGLGLLLKDNFRERDHVILSGSYSRNHFEHYRLTYGAPGLLGDSTSFSLLLEYDLRTREPFYGIGNESDAGNEFSVALERSTVRARVDWQLSRQRSVRFQLGLVGAHVYDGDDTSLETDLDKIADSLNQVLPPPDKLLEPAIDFRSARVLSIGATFTNDLRNHPGRPTRGTLQQLSLDYGLGIDGSPISDFVAVRLDLRAYLHLFSHRVLALRLLAETIEINDGDENIRNPYYLRTSLGGSKGLSGFGRNRFIGDALALTALEYRYPIWVKFDAFLFGEAGRVFDGQPKDLTIARWRHSYGMGLRLWGDSGESFRITVARSSEETRLQFTYGQDF